MKATPFNLVYSVEDPDEKLEILNCLLRTCIDKHAPLRKTKITRPSAPWLHKENIRKLQKERDQRHYLAHQMNLASVWDKYCEVRNKIRMETKKVKCSFYNKALSCKKPKELWDTIHRILNLVLQPISADPNMLNQHFTLTSQRLLQTRASSLDSILQFIDSLPDSQHTDEFELCHVSYSEEVLKTLASMRLHCSTGVDQIPVKYLKLSTEYISSPLTHIINC